MMTDKRVVFLGSKALGASILYHLYDIAPSSLAGVITIDDSADERCAIPQFKAFAQKTQVPLVILQKPSQLKSAIVEFQPDVCLVVGWYWILKPDLLDLVPYGWLGIHASLLPKYRGSAPLVWALINGETETGLSLFYFDEGMDTGDIVDQRKFDIDFEDTIAEVLTKVEKQAIEIVREQFPKILKGQATRTKQDHSKATFVASRHPKDGKIDWNQSASQIYNFIRAQSHPYPGAFGYLENEIVRIWHSKPFEYPFYGTPGQIAMLAQDHIVVTCGNGTALRLYQVQVEGKDEVNAVQLLKFGQHLK